MTRFTTVTSRIVLTGLVIATGFAAQAASGDGEGKRDGKMRGERPSFEMLDADKNGELTMEELQAHARVRFDERDANKDGKLSAEEMVKDGQKRAEKRAGKMIERHDTDGDGMVSFEEMSNGRKEGRGAKMFERIDADSNGTISEEEYAQMKEMGRGHGKRMKKRGDN